MTASHNASGAAALAWLDSLHATDANGAVTNRKWPEAQQVKALVESAMALPGKWRKSAQKYRAAGHDLVADHFGIRADELEAIFGPAPPATDAPELSDWPEFRERRIALFKLWSGIPLDEVEKARDAYCDATPPAGGGANNYGNASERDSQTDHRTAQCAQDTAEKMASRAGSGDSVRSGESPDIATQHALDIGAMVNRFLAWRLPDDFGPDAGISFTPNPQFPHAWPTGTNLLTAVQARAMFDHCAGGARVGQEAPTDSIRRVVAFIFRYFGSPAMAGELSEEMVADTRTVESWLAAPTPETP